MSQRAPDPPPPQRVRWSEILAYAKGFEELDIVRAIDAEAQRVHVPLDAVSARRPRGRSLETFGPLSRLQALPESWRIAEMTSSPDCVRVVISRADGQAVTLAVSDGAAGAPSGPFDEGQLRVWYEHTDLALDSFAAAGHAIARLLKEAAAGVGVETALREWVEPGAAARVSTRKLEDASDLEVRADGKLYLRITDSCQERCVFCFFYDTHAVDNLVRHHDLSEIVGRVDPDGIRQVVLTGGEPTLHPSLPEYVGVLHRRGFREIIIQTNGVRLAEDGYLDQLAPFKDRLGLGFSLHSATSDVNDALTTVSKGFFEKKLEGIRRAARGGFKCKITLVLNRRNLAELVPFVELCQELTDGKCFLQFSLPSFEGRMNLFLDTYPRLTELAEALPPALRRARELELRVALCHQCQVPPCVIPDDVQHLESLWFCETPQMWSHDHAYGDQCDGCAMRAHCSGIWQGYADHFGTSELRPFEDHEVEPRSDPSTP